MEIDFKPDQVKSLIALRKKTNPAQNELSFESRKAIKIYLNELDRDLKKLKSCLNKKDFPDIRHSAYGLQMNSNWIIDIIKKYE